MEKVITTTKKNEEAITEFMAMIEQSWPWQLLTDGEKKSFKSHFNRHEKNIKGNFDARWRICQALWDMFLDGIALGKGYKTVTAWCDANRE